MKPTDFSIHVTNFLTHHLAAQRNLSPNTIKAYRDVFTLLLRFCRDGRGIAPEKLRLEQIDVSLVIFVYRVEGLVKSGEFDKAVDKSREFRYLKLDEWERVQRICQS